MARDQYNWTTGLCACDMSYHILYLLKLSMKLNNRFAHVTWVDIYSIRSRYQWNWTTGLCACDTGWYILYLLKVSMKLNNGSMRMWHMMIYPLLAQGINEIEQPVYAHVTQVDMFSFCSRYQWNWRMGLCACDTGWHILYLLKVSLKLNNRSMHMWHWLIYPLLVQGINEIEQWVNAHATQVDIPSTSSRY